jgi:general L-amino acid transport system permease protein
MIAWVRANLLSTPLNIALTIVGVALLLLIFVPLVDWAILEADWSGSTPAECENNGACWVFIRQRMSFYIYGFYPLELAWRVDVVLLLLAVLVVPQMIPGVPGKRPLGWFTLTAFPILAYIILAGGIFGLTRVDTDYWGGLMLTLVIAYVAIVASLPLGIVLALGRRSTMPVVRAVSVAYIELWRGVPLISVLFMASVMLPMFMPEGVSVDKLLRALIGIVLFQAAYMAEVIRGGLAAIPRGQFEAASALGLGYWKMMRLIVLPQALRIVIPGIVNTFIARFKDTTLVLIIGLLDVLGAIQTTIKDPAWGNVATEGYVFGALVFFVFCFGMSRYSQALERKLDTGHRR